jgi:hypothetical protein
MGNRILMIIFIFLFSVLSAVPTVFADNQVYENYVNKEKGFSISVPREWKKISSYMGSCIAAVSLPNTANDKSFQNNMVVVFESLEKNMDNDNYLNASVAAMKKSLNRFEIVQKGDLPTVANQVTGKYLIYQHSEDPRLQVVVFFFSSNGKGFTVTCTSTPDKFKAIYPVFLEIGKSFRVSSN